MPSQFSRFVSRWIVCFVAASLCGASALSENRVQVAGIQQPVSATAQTATGAKLPLRVMLVISNSVWDYKPAVFMTHWDYGPRLAKQAQLAFAQSFAAVRVSTVVETSALGTVELVVLLDSPEGRKLSGVSSFTVSLSAQFVARTPGGEEILRAQEEETGKGKDAFKLIDQLAEAITHKFILDLMVSPRAQALLSPRPKAGPRGDDSPALGSAGLDLEPLPPWQHSTADFRGDSIFHGSIQP